MKKLTTVKNSATTLGTEYSTITYQQLLGFAKDITGEAGYNASAKDLFKLVCGGRNNFYEKLVFEIKGESPISHFAVQKLGMVYSIIMRKETGAEYFTQRATLLINLVEDFKPSETSIRLDTMKGKNLIELKEMIHKALKTRGKNTTVLAVLKLLQPNLRMKSGSYVVYTPSFKITFNCMLGCVITEVEDLNGFKFSTNNASQLLRILS